MDERYSTEGPECPHCGYVLTPDDPIYYDDANYTEDECPECDGKFSVQAFTQTSWTTHA